jgi:hypothetical protein
MNRVKELHEKKVRTAAKKPKIDEEVIAYDSSEFCNWREEIDLKESDWTPSSGSGPTNSSSQQFTYVIPNFQTGQPNTVIDAMDKALTEVETIGEFNAILDAVDKDIQSRQKKSVNESTWNKLKKYRITN